MTGPVADMLEGLQPPVDPKGPEQPDLDLTIYDRAVARIQCEECGANIKASTWTWRGKLAEHVDKFGCRKVALHVLFGLALDGRPSSTTDEQEAQA